MAGYVPSHSVPATGLDAWDRPDPSAAPVARLDPWLDVRLLRAWGGWGEVECSNGWTCWVDAAALAPVAAPAAPAATPTPITAAPATAPAGGGRVTSYAQAYQVAHPYGRTPSGVVSRGAARGAGAAVRLGVTGIGALLVVVGAFLPWLRDEGAPGVGSPDIPVQVLVGVDAAGTGPVSVAVLLVAAAAVALLAAAWPRLALARRVAGWCAVLCATLFVAQLQRQLGQIPAGTEGAPTLLGTIGLGVVLVLAGGLLIALGPGAKAPR